MIDRILRDFSYSMNRDQVSTTRQEPETDEIPEAGYRCLRMRPLRRRVPGEAMGTFNRARGRKAEKTCLAQTTNPFIVSQQTVPQQEPKVSPPATPRIISIGDRFNIGGGEAILTYIGATKFEVLPIGCKRPKKLKLSAYPQFKIRQHKIWVQEEAKHEAI